MKVIHCELDKNRSGLMELMADDDEDMWFISNIVRPGDELRAPTFRKVRQSRACRAETSVRLKVETTDFDASTSKLRVRGRNVQENEFVSKGIYHTLEIEPDRKFTIYKNEWDSVTIKRIKYASDPTKQAELAAITMQEGLAFVYLVTSAKTVERSKINVDIPKKTKRNEALRKKCILNFFELIAASVYRHLNFEVLKTVLVTSQGVLKEEFLNYLMKDATNKGHKHLLENRSKFMLVRSIFGLKHAVKEAMQDPDVVQRLTDVRTAEETRLLQQFLCLLGTAPDRAYYGYRHVKKAANNQAVEALLVSDSLFRSHDNDERRRYIALVEQVKNSDGKVKTFLSKHASGEKLDQMTGVAAVLRFPMPESEEEEEEDRGDDDT